VDRPVVVELKRGHSVDRVVGQVARYMGWVRAHLATNGQDVAGIVVAHGHDDRLRYAAAAVPGLAILTYQVTFHLIPVPAIAVLLGIPCPGSAADGRLLYPLAIHASGHIRSVLI
jgi:hypothetical protein